MSMERIIIAEPVVSVENRAANLFSLSQTRRRIAHEYKRWALEAETNGNLPEYRRCRKESDRLWHSAKWALDMAKSAKKEMGL